MSQREARGRRRSSLRFVEACVVMIFRVEVFHLHGFRTLAVDFLILHTTGVGNLTFSDRSRRQLAFCPHAVAAEA